MSTEPDWQVAGRKDAHDQGPGRHSGTEHEVAVLYFAPLTGAREVGSKPVAPGRQVICPGCFRIRGHDPEGHRQRCRCERQKQRRWPGYDFNTYVELCYCCGIEPLRSGSRWSLFFCAECKDRVLDLNRRMGYWAIPIGRHSAMHGLLLDPGDTADPDDVEAFAANMRSLFDAIDLLSERAVLRVRENLQMLGYQAGEEVPLGAYLEAARNHPLEKEAAFLELVAQLP